ncbi:MAG: sel1 repeat family protein [Candidatus Omnitrophica bacterium]|nr:sel1 repeat family protein [Candidatus Omnitrophota bacterium]MCA9442475.1 sel1 repeat family protein [Candidatus Omnitrophota bacterium]
MKKDPYETTRNLLAEGDIAGALAILNPLAMQGEAEAQCMMGHLYLLDSDAVTGPQALEWLRRSADQDFPPALYILSSLQSDGDDGFFTDGPKTNEARDMLRRAADLGYAPAQQTLGSVLCDGEYGFEQNLAEGRKWYAAAVKQGFVDAFFDYACMLMEGEGGEADPETGMRLLHEGAKQSDFYCADFLAEIYSEGLFGIEKNPDLSGEFQDLAEEIDAELDDSIPDPSELLQVTQGLTPIVNRIEEVAGEEAAKEFLSIFMRNCLSEEDLSEEIEDFLQGLTSQMSDAEVNEFTNLLESAFRSLEE